MRKLLWLALALVLLYAGYWFIGARGTEKAIAAWTNAREAEGWQAEYASVETTGFPMRFDTTIREALFADPQSGVAYSTPQIDILSQSHRPTRLTARFAETAAIATPYQTIEVTQDRAEAELFVDPGPALTLDHSAAILNTVVMQSSLGWGLVLEAAQFTTQRDADDPLTHAIAFNAKGFAPTGGLMATLDPSGLLSDRFETLDIDMTARFDAPWNIHALEGPRPQPTHLKLADLSAQWGELTLRLAGEFDIDAQGTPTGKLSVKAENWRQMIQIATAMGAIPENMSGMVERAGEMIAGLSGRKDTIDADLTLANGTISMGFIPLGPAPQIRIR